MTRCLFQVITTFLKDIPYVCFATNYFLAGLKSWKANIDIQPVFCLLYLLFIVKLPLAMDAIFIFHFGKSWKANIDIQPVFCLLYLLFIVKLPLAMSNI